MAHYVESADGTTFHYEIVLYNTEGVMYVLSDIEYGVNETIDVDGVPVSAKLDSQDFCKVSANSFLAYIAPPNRCHIGLSII